MAPRIQRWATLALLHLPMYRWADAASATASYSGVGRCKCRHHGVLHQAGGPSASDPNLKTRWVSRPSPRGRSISNKRAAARHRSTVQAGHGLLSPASHPQPGDDRFGWHIIGIRRLWHGEVGCRNWLWRLARRRPCL